MARIVIVTYGSLGDLHPAIALAFGLRARGHHTTLATSETYRGRIHALGLTFHGVRPDLSLSDEALVRRVMDGERGTRYLLRDLVFPAAREMYADLLPLAQEADLIITSELVCAAPILAETLRVRWAYFALSPIALFPASDYSLLPGSRALHAVQSLGPAANRLLLRAGALVSHSWWQPVRALRHELGLPAGQSPIFRGKFSPLLNLALFSSTFQPAQPDWPAQTVQTGFLFHDETTARGSEKVLPSEVQSFLEAGEPPIVFTLGSAAVNLAGKFYEQSAAAASRLGRRALLLLGRNAPPPRLPPSVLAWDYLPYAQIFPKASAVVHQGGIGTTAQALRAGRRMVVVPFAHDQFDNARRVERLGAGRTISRRGYSEVSAARELSGLLNDARAAQTTAAIAQRIQAERTLDHTCDTIERALC